MIQRAHRAKFKTKYKDKYYCVNPSNYITSVEEFYFTTTASLYNTTFIVDQTPLIEFRYETYYE